MAPMRQLDERERLDWLQLIRTPNIGPISFQQLIAKYGAADEALAALSDGAHTGLRKTRMKLANRAALEDELNEAERRNARLIAACEQDYPAMLAEIPAPPPLIYLCGEAAHLQKPAIAIIGARNASGVGRKLARLFAGDLGRAGFAIVSGLARGIDGAAHEASLETGAIAVVAGGVDVIYPPEHQDLTEEIAKNGAIISECPMGYRPTAKDFPKRNRLISGLARGVVVVEAAARSGTMITVRYALEQGREVFAVPGSPLDPRCQGANRLIRDGATLVQRADDILEVLDAQMRRPQISNGELFETTTRPQSIDHTDADAAALRVKLLELLSPTPLHRDEILREIKAPAGVVADVLLDLVLSGDASEHEGGRFSLGD